MARSHGVLKTAIWAPGSSFRTLGIAPQWCYAMLISQPQISNLGVLAYTPDKWLRLAADLTRDTLNTALDELADGRFVIVDIDAAELLVRTFIKHDKVWSQPALVTNARRLIHEVESATIRDTLIERHPWLVNDDTKEAISLFETGFVRPLLTPLSQGVFEKTGGPQGQGLGKGKGVLRSSEIENLALAFNADRPGSRKRSQVKDAVDESLGRSAA